MARLEAAAAANDAITDDTLLLDVKGPNGRAPRRPTERAAPHPFTDFGPSAFMPHRGRVHNVPLPRDPADIRRQMRDQCPLRPGVYGMIDRRQQLVYVGVSRRLRARLVTYFQGGDAIRKERCVAAQARALVWEVVGHEFVAQLRELELIRRFQPRLNVKGRAPLRPLGYLYISQEDAPRLRLARRIPNGVRYSWGPLGLGRRIREAVDTVNRLFKLCDCPASVPMHFADQRQLFALDLRLACLRGEIGTCLGPCAGRCTRHQYTAQLNAARALLDGRDSERLARLEQNLQDAAALQQYERAARLRDTLDCVETLVDALHRLRHPPVPSDCIYPLQVGRRTVWYLVVGGRVAAAARAPVTVRRAQRTLQQIERLFHTSSVHRPENDRHAKHIVSTWFQKHPDEAAALLTPAAARDQCTRRLAS